jgi:hypothetical protein
MTASRSPARRTWLGLLMPLIVACSAAVPSTTPSSQRPPLATEPAETASPSPTPVATAAPSVAEAPPPTPDLSSASDPANFTATVDNPWLPFIPGTVFTYTGIKDGKPAVDVVTVTAKTAVIDGVTCVVIEDRLELDGVLEEETRDYYTQDLDGNVWYFGEDTKELDAKGRVVSREGTWHAGVHGAMAGVFMEANPTVGNEYAQESYAGHAQDQFRVKSLTATVDVPFGAFTDALLTEEWTPLEPDILDNKFYVRGLGEVREVTVKGPTEELRLVKVERP